MTPSEIAKKIRTIQLHTRKAVNDLMAGEYASAFKGTGMEFQEVREYQHGDDVKDIDWNVTARQGRPFIKRFTEERELTVILAVDLSASGTFGSRDKTKNELAAELCAMLAISAAQSNDKVGLLTFTDKVETYVPPAKGSPHALRLVRDILAAHPTGRGTNIADAVDYLGKVLKRKAVVFLISDFQDHNYYRKLAVFAQKHEVLAFLVADHGELELTNAGIMAVQDAETGELMYVDTSSRKVREAFRNAAAEQLRKQKEGLQKAGIDTVLIETDQDYANTLIAFFKTREHRR